MFLLVFNSYFVISAGLDIDLNKMPETEGINLNQTPFHLEKDLVSQDSSSQPSTILGKRVREKEEKQDDPNKRRKQSNEASRRYYQNLKIIRPEKLAKIKDRKRERYQNMNFEEKKRFKENDAKNYQRRKEERGFGSNYNNKLKEARKRMKDGIATKEDIDMVEKNRRSELLWYHSFNTNLIKSSHNHSSNQKNKNPTP